MSEKVKKKIKKWTFILCGILIFWSILFYLCYPKYMGSQTDGGTKIWKSKVYTLVKWNQLPHYDEEGNKLINPKKDGWKIYWWPNQDEWMYL